MNESCYAARSDRGRLQLVCMKKREHLCPFSVKIGAAGDRFAVKERVEHTCPTRTHDRWWLKHSTRLLAPRHLATINGDRLLKPKQLKAMESTRFGNQISSNQAYRIKRKAEQMGHGTEEEGYRKLPASVKRIEEAQQSANLSILPSKVFHSTGIFLMTIIWALHGFYPLLILDAAHMDSRYGMKFVVAARVDINDEIVVVGYGIIPGESDADWSNFLTLLWTAIRCTFTTSNDNNLPPEGIAKCHEYMRRLAIISDRGSGLLPPLDRIFHDSHLFWCTWHLQQNFQEHFGFECKAWFTQMIYETEWNNVLASLKKVSQDCWEYVKKMPVEKYAYWACVVKRPRFGRETSNIAESINGFLKE